MIINSVDRALDLMLLLHTEKREMGVSEMAERLGIYKSTVFRTLYTLEQKGFVMQDEKSEKYSLGMKIFSMGMGMGERISIRKIVRPYARRLVEVFNEVVNVSVLDTTEQGHPKSLTIHKEVGESQIIVANPAVGALTSPFGSSVGKCLLAFNDLPFEQYRTEDLPKYTQNTITDWDELLEELNNIRTRGYSLDDEELEVGLTCIGAPILNSEGKAIAAISLSGPTHRMRKGNFEDKIATVVSVAKEVSEELG